MLRLIELLEKRQLLAAGDPELLKDIFAGVDSSFGVMRYPPICQRLIASIG